MPRSAPDWLPGPWLPEDRKHPIRPDLPWFRHLTFEEGHAVEIGLGLALLLYWSQTLGLGGAVFPIAAYLARVALGMKHVHDEDYAADHTLGVHDIASDPWYFIVATVAVYVGLVLVWGIP